MVDGDSKVASDATDRLMGGGADGSASIGEGLTEPAAVGDREDRAEGKEVQKGRSEDDDEVEEDEGPEGALKAEIIEDAAEQAAEILLERFEQFSGPMLPAVEFYKFEEADRERVLRISEARTSDESVRRDRVIAMQEQVTTAQVGIARKTLWINAAFYGGSVLAVFISYALWENLALSAIFLGPATIKMVGSAVVAAVRRRGEDSLED